MSEEKVSLEMCKKLVSGEIATRGLIVGLLTKPLQERYGDDVLEIIRNANYEAGKVAGRNTARALARNSLAAIADLFGRSTATKLFNPKIVKETGDRVVIHWRSCPIPSLLSNFKEKGFADDYLDFLCSILEPFDNGFVEGFNQSLTAMTPPQTGETGLNKKGDFCTIIISKKK